MGRHSMSTQSAWAGSPVTAIQVKSAKMETICQGESTLVTFSLYVCRYIRHSQSESCSVKGLGLATSQRSVCMVSRRC